MRDKILSKVEQCFLIAEKYYGRTFQRPTNIIFKRNGTTAGYCDMHSRELMFQLDLADTNPDTFINRTVPHEVAHWVQFSQYGYRVSPHGREWQHVMRNVYGLDPSRCHSYDVNVTTTKRQTRHTYKCACKTFQITTTTHNKMSKGQHRICANCRTRLTLVEEGNPMLQKYNRLVKQIEALKKATTNSLNTTLS